MTQTRTTWPMLSEALGIPAQHIGILLDVIVEMNRGVDKFGTYNSRHEAYAVLLEEIDELFAEIKSKDENTRDVEEAKQIAALALRYAIEFRQI